MIKKAKYEIVCWWYSCERIYNDIRCWFRHNFNKHHWNVIKSAIKGHPFDYCYLLDLEYAKLNEMYHYFSTSDIAEDNPKTAREIKLAMKLNRIISEEENLYDYIRNGKGLGFDYKCLVNVNLNNIDRFIKYSPEVKFISDKMPHYLYIEKAKNLYGELMKHKIFTWWD